MAVWRICLVFTAAMKLAEGNKNSGEVMLVKFIYVLETSKLQICQHYVDCFVRTAPFLNITSIRKSGHWSGQHPSTNYQQEIFELSNTMLPLETR